MIKALDKTAKEINRSIVPVKNYICRDKTLEWFMRPFRQKWRESRNEFCSSSAETELEIGRGGKDWSSNG
jgi:hypothetical protein